MIFIFDENGLLCDGVNLSEDPGVTATITAHPREVGVPITDNAQPEARDLSLVMGVSDTPVIGEQRRGLAAAIYDTLEAALERSATVTVITSQRTYRGYQLASVRAPRASSSGNGLEIPIDLERITTTQSVTATVDPAILSALLRSSGKPKPKTQGADKGANAKQAKAGRKSWLKGIGAALSSSDAPAATE